MFFFFLKFWQPQRLDLFCAAERFGTHVKETQGQRLIRLGSSFENLCSAEIGLQTECMYFIIHLSSVMLVETHCSLWTSGIEWRALWKRYYKESPKYNKETCVFSTGSFWGLCNLVRLGCPECLMHPSWMMLHFQFLLFLAKFMLAACPRGLFPLAFQQKLFDHYPGAMGRSTKTKIPSLLSCTNSTKAL